MDVLFGGKKATADLVDKYATYSLFLPLLLADAALAYASLRTRSGGAFLGRLFLFFIELSCRRSRASGLPDLLLSRPRETPRINPFFRNPEKTR